MIIDDERCAGNQDFEYEQIAPIAKVEPQDPIQLFNAFLARETEMTDYNFHNWLRNDVFTFVSVMQPQLLK